MSSTASKSARSSVAVRPGAAHQGEQLVFRRSPRRRRRPPSAAPECRARCAESRGGPARRGGWRAPARRIPPARRAWWRTGGPWACAPTQWPDAADALQRHRDGARRADLHTRSTVPISIPSSSEAVATTARSSPFLSRRSASRRNARDRLPWCGSTASSPSRSPRWCATRSARRRVFTNTSVVRLLADQLGHAVVDLAPHFVGGHRAQLVARHFHRQVHVAPVADVHDAGACRSETRPHLRSASPWPKARCAAASAPPFCSTRRSSRASVSARCEPRLSSATAWISSTITVRTRAQHLARPGRREQNVERFRRGHQDVRPLARHPLALPLRRVAGAQGGADGRQRDAALAPPAPGSRPAALPGSCGRRCSAP